MAAAVGGCKAPCFSPRRLRPRRCRPTSATVRRTFFRRRGGLTKLNPVSTYACHSSTRSPRASLMPTCAARQVRLPLERRQPAARAILPYHSLSCAPHGTRAQIPTAASHRIAQLRTACFVRVLLARPVAKRTGVAADSDANCRFAPSAFDGASLRLCGSGQSQRTGWRCCLSAGLRVCSKCATTRTSTCAAP